MLKMAWQCLQELQALIKYIQINKGTDSDWFTITSNKDGTHWSGKCWYVHELMKYEYDFEFDIPATYPATAPEIKIPSLDGKTAKMYRGGAICLTVHFKPLWAKNRRAFSQFDNIEHARIGAQFPCFYVNLSCKSLFAEGRAWRSIASRRCLAPQYSLTVSQELLCY